MSSRWMRVECWEWQTWALQWFRQCTLSWERRNCLLRPNPHPVHPPVGWMQWSPTCGELPRQGKDLTSWWLQAWAAFVGPKLRLPRPSIHVELRAIWYMGINSIEGCRLDWYREHSERKERNSDFRLRQQLPLTSLRLLPAEGIPREVWPQLHHRPPEWKK